MKSYIKSLPLLALLAILACSKEDDAAFIDVSQKEIVFEGDAQTVSVTVTSNVEWTVSVQGSWLDVSEGSEGSESFDSGLLLKAGINSTGTERSAIVSLESADFLRSIKVCQKPFSGKLTVNAPASVQVEKGQKLVLEVSTELSDWEFRKTAGDWLEFESADQGELTFSLNPAVRFTPQDSAVFEFTSALDPLLFERVSIAPLEFADFSASASKDFRVEKGGQLVIDVSSNVSWQYNMSAVDWLTESSVTDSQIVFDCIPENLTDTTGVVTFSFSSPDYANVSQELTVKPVAVYALQIPVDKAGCSILHQDGEASGLEGEEYLFDGCWGCGIYGNYHAFPDGDSSSSRSYSYKSFMSTAEESSDWFTVDAGSYVRLSRFVTYLYWPYTYSCPLAWTVYRYDGDGTPDSSWTGWTAIGSIDVRNVYADEIRGKLTEGDAFPRMRQGETVSVSEDESVPDRYYRFKMTANGYSVYTTEFSEWYSGRIHWLNLAEISLFRYSD